MASEQHLSNHILIQCQTKSRDVGPCHHGWHKHVLSMWMEETASRLEGSCEYIA